MGEAVELWRERNVAVVTFANQPDGLMDRRTLEALEHAIHEIARDEAVSVVVFRSEVEGAFVRHHDVREIAAATGDGDVSAIVHRVYDKVASLAVPTIAIINGACMGGGLELALCCTLRYAGSRAGPFGFPEISIGIFPGAGGTQRAIAAIGRAAAVELMLTGRLFDAHEALRVGLVHRLFDDVEHQAMKLAHRLSTRQRSAVAAILELTGRFEPANPTGFQAERDAFNRLLTEPGTRELVLALAASRDPVVR